MLSTDHILCAPPVHNSITGVLSDSYGRISAVPITGSVLDARVRQRLNAVLTARAIQQVDFARDIGWSKNALNMFLSGSRGIPGEYIISSCQVLGFTVDRFVGPTDLSAQELTLSPTPNELVGMPSPVTASRGKKPLPRKGASQHASESVARREKELRITIAHHQAILAAVRELASRVSGAVEAALAGDEAEAVATLGRLLRVSGGRDDRSPARRSRKTP